MTDKESNQDEWVPTTLAKVIHRLGDNYVSFAIVKETNSKTGSHYNHVNIDLYPRADASCALTVRINGYDEFETGEALVDLGKQLIAKFSNIPSE